MTSLEVVAEPQDMQRRALAWRAAGKRVGFVPTMGALHAGHVSLVEEARAQCEIVVTSLFVNPTQFGPHEDFSRYPRTFHDDLTLLNAARCDVVFAPTAAAMYPPECTASVVPPRVAEPWEGVCRPGHFGGVCTVVLKLLEIVPCWRAYFGQKDYQQQLVLRHMVRDFNLPVEIITCPTVRSADGLALSSRNRYLSPQEYAQALGLSRALREVEQAWRGGEQRGMVLREQLRSILGEHGIERIDYATIVSADTLVELDVVALPAVVLIACHVGTTRLIDNCLLTASE
jgi:pantoate--beta-alanine ligase